MSQTCQYRHSPNQSLVAQTRSATGSDQSLDAPTVCKVSSNVSYMTMLVRLWRLRAWLAAVRTVHGASAHHRYLSHPTFSFLGPRRAHPSECIAHNMKESHAQ
eukprot:6068131-Pleurochrysis_carterae.AAC.1